MTISKPSAIVAVARKIRAYYKAKYLGMEADAYFDGVVHNCCRVSAANNSLAFAIHRVGPFGGPVVEQIQRPNDVLLHEKGDYVVVKDGYVYELRKEER